MIQAVLTVVLYLFLPVKFRQWQHDGLAPCVLRYDNWGVCDARRWWYHDGSYCRRTRGRRLIQGSVALGRLADLPVQVDTLLFTHAGGEYRYLGRACRP